MREFTVLVREITSTQSAFGLMQETWPVDLGPLEPEDMEKLWSQDVTMSFPAGRKGRAVFDVNGYTPDISESALPTVQQCLQEHLATGEVSAHYGKTLHAARFEISGCYLHRINFSFQGDNTTEDYLYIGGLSNRVMPGVLHERCKSSTAWIKRPFAKLLGGMGLADNQAHSRRFKERFHEASGNVHLLDSQAVIVDAIELAGHRFDVTDLGYSLTSSAGGRGRIDLQHVTDKEELGVGFSVVIGPANRDRFTVSLRLCGDLLFGRIGITLDDEGRLVFVLYDNQYYGSLTAEYYASVLRFLYGEAIPRARSVLEA